MWLFDYLNPWKETVCEAGDFICHLTDGASQLQDYPLGGALQVVTAFVEQHPYLSITSALGATYIVNKVRKPKIQEVDVYKAENTGYTLDYHNDLKPLLRHYLAQVFPELIDKPILTEETAIEITSTGHEIDHRQFFGHEDYSCLKTPKGNVCGFVLESGVTQGSQGNLGGSTNLVRGYYDALLGCLEKDYNPRKINIVTVINHHDAQKESDGFQDLTVDHFTCSVAEIKLQEGFLQRLRDRLPGNFDDFSTHRQLGMIKTILNVHADDLMLKGASTVDVSFYDSYNPNQALSPYLSDYRQSMADVVRLNREIPFELHANRCIKQVGNTCGDHSLFNGFVKGVLELDPFEVINGVIDWYTFSAALRGQTERVVPGYVSSPEQDSMVRELQGVVTNAVQDVRREAQRQNRANRSANSL